MQILPGIKMVLKEIKGDPISGAAGVISWEECLTLFRSLDESAIKIKKTVIEEAPDYIKEPLLDAVSTKEES